MYRRAILPLLLALTIIAIAACGGATGPEQSDASEPQPMAQAPTESPLPTAAPAAESPLPTAAVTTGESVTEVQKLRARIVKKKWTFKAYAQTSGGEWEEIGEQKLLKFKNPTLRVCQYNMPYREGYEDPPAEVEAVVKHVTVKQVE